MLSATNFVRKNIFCKYAKCSSPLVKSQMLKYSKIVALFHHKRLCNAECSLKYLNPRCLLVPPRSVHSSNPVEHDGLRYLDLKYSIPVPIEERYNVTPDNIWECFHTVVIEEYAKLSHFPWLCRYNYATMHKQLRLAQKFPMVFKHIKEYDYFKFLIHELNCNVDQVPDLHVPSILLDMLHLEINAGAAFYRLYNRIHDIIPMSTLNSLGHLAYLGGYFKSDYIMLAETLHRLRELVLALESDEINICDLSSVVISLCKYMSSELLELIAGRILKMDVNRQLTCDLRSIISSIKLLNIVRKHQWRDTPQVLNLADKLSATAMIQVHDFDGYHISVVQRHAELPGSSNGYTIIRALQHRSLELLSDESITAYDMTKMLTPFNGAVPLSMKHEVEVYIMQKIRHGDVDMLSAAKICVSIMRFKSQNPDLITVLQKHLVDNFEQYASIRDRHHNVSSLHIWNKRIPNRKYLKYDLFDKVVKLFDSQSGIMVWDVSLLSFYILTTATDVIPDSVLRKILVIVPQCKAKEIYFIIMGLRRLPKMNKNSVLYAQFLEIFEAVDRNVYQHQKSFENIQNRLEITLLAKLMDVNLLVSQSYHDDGIFEDITITQIRFSKLSVVLSKMNYCQPQLMEKMCSFVLCNNDAISVAVLTKFIKITAKNGYCPDHLDRFNEIYNDLGYKFIDNMDKENLLQLANDLAVLQIFPDILLQHIFSFDFIEQIDVLPTGGYIDILAQY